MKDTLSHLLAALQRGGHEVVPGQPGHEEEGRVAAPAVALRHHVLDEGVQVLRLHRDCRCVRAGRQAGGQAEEAGSEWQARGKSDTNAK